jgi:hypothetical protein
MKKTLIFIVVLLSLTLGVAPFAIGVMLEKYNQQMKANYHNDTNIIMEDTSYQRGWFHTQITTHITVQPNTAKPMTFTIHENLRHGPILWGYGQPIALGFSDLHADVSFSNAVKNTIQQALGSMPNIRISGHIAYNGSSAGTLNIPAFHHHNTDKDITIEFQPLLLQASSDIQMKQSVGDLNWQGITMTSPQGSAHIGQNTSHFNITKLANVWVGNMDWHADKVHITNLNKDITISGIHVTSQTDMDEQQRVSSQQSIHVDNFELNQRHFEAGNIQLVVQHIPAASLEKLRKVQAQAISTQNQYAAGMNMLGLLPEIIAAEPIIAINDASLQTPDGKIDASLRIAMKGLQKNDVFNFPKLKKHIEADMFIRFPAKLVHENNQDKINSFIEKGWLIQQGDMLEGKLHMLNGELTINQQSIPLPF